MSVRDIHLIFPPQWSPFQPFLSTPSLKAYLERKGFSVHQSDWNVEFYSHFIDRSRVTSAVERLERYVDNLGSENEDYRNHAYVALGIFGDFRTKRKKAEKLRSRDGLTSIEEFHESVTSFKRLLYAFSVAEPIVEVGTSSLSTGRVMRSMAAIDAFCKDDDDNPFLPFFTNMVETIAETPRYFGISIIGLEQILPSLTLGAVLKKRFPDVPILVGGSVFSRLVERTEVILHLFDRYFDFVVRYEGERPLEAFLGSSNPRADRTPGMVFVENGATVFTDMVSQLGMDDIPTPDFDDLDLSRYFTPQLVLPLLSTRGCYWDKCAFCYHGMIYGDRYRMRNPSALLEDVNFLSQRYGATHFALNDEAIPPKLFEKLPAVFPKKKYFFTGLYKFEKYFRPHHFKDMYEIGFRSLYIGLESADERVQRHMKKNNTQDVMTSNLRDAAEAGIWNHTFNFFGFPTETHDEAMNTADFLIDNSDIIHSEGTGTFSLEHNAPIARNPSAFGIKRVIDRPGNVLELYYDYEVETGLTQANAEEMVETFRTLKKDRNAYRYSGWIPREHLLVLLSQFDRDTLRCQLETLDGDVQAGVRWANNVSWFWRPDKAGNKHYFVVNSQAGKVLETNKDAVIVLECLPPDTPLATLIHHFPVLEQIVR